MPSDRLATLLAEVRAFAVSRDWTDFHDPRSLILALTSEVGELAAELRWVPDGAVDAHLEEPAHRGAFEAEMADVLIFLLLLADVTNVDLAAAVRCKMVVNSERYDVASSRGRGAKYTEFDRDSSTQGRDN